MTIEEKKECVQKAVEIIGTSFLNLVNGDDFAYNTAEEAVRIAYPDASYKEIQESLHEAYIVMTSSIEGSIRSLIEVYKEDSEETENTDD